MGTQGFKTPQRHYGPTMVAPRALALGIILLTPALIGCIGTEAPQALEEASTTPPSQATLRCLDGGEGEEATCNVDTLIEPEREGNEVTIAVNPTDPDNVVAGAKDYHPESAGDCVWDGIYHTLDGGETFESRNLPGSPWLLVNDPDGFERNDASQFWCMSDPVVTFGPEGTLYYSFLAYQGDPITGSAIGKEATCAANEEAEAVPCSGANDVLFNRVSIGVMISTDGGESIDDVVLIDQGTFPVNFHDRQWISVDQDTGDVYIAWTAIFTPGNLVYKSTDNGRTWEGPVLLNELPTSAHGPGSLFIDNGPDETVYVSGCGADGPYVTVSTDGGETYAPWERVVEAPDEGMEAQYRTPSNCRIAVDASNGPHQGDAYVAYQATPEGDRDIFLARSTDDGQTWSEPIKLNLDEGDHDQFFPAINVNENGVIDVTWWDRRDDPDNRLLDIYHRYSLDGGETFSEELRVTEHSSDPAHSLHQGGFVFIGDYLDIDANGECAWPVWVDTRHEKADVMTTCIQRPSTPATP